MREGGRGREEGGRDLPASIPASLPHACVCACVGVQCKGLSFSAGGG